jgi:hypothetical protein
MWRQIGKIKFASSEIIVADFGCNEKLNHSDGGIALSIHGNFVAIAPLAATDASWRDYDVHGF